MLFRNESFGYRSKLLPIFNATASVSILLSWDKFYDSTDGKQEIKTETTITGSVLLTINK